MDNKLVTSLEDLEKLFSSRMREYEDKLQKATSGDRPIHSDLAALSQDFIEFKSFVCQTLTHLKNQIELLSLGLDRHETALRKKVLLLHGIEEKPNEKLCEVIINLFHKKIKVTDISSDHLDVCHRLGVSRGKTRPVLVRFLDMEHRRLIWDNKTALKGSGITISEFLTKLRHRVFMSARKHFGINSCWSTEGKIVILTPDKIRRKIVSMGELEPLMAQFPASTSMSDDPDQSDKSPPKAAAPPRATSSKVAAKAPKKTRR